MSGRHSFLLGITLPFVLALCLVAMASELHALPPVERSLLSNGLVFLTCREPSLPFVTIHLLIDAGSSKDPKGREGLADLTSRVVTLGTATRSAAEISDTLDYMGASLMAGANKDFSTLSLRILKKDLDRGLTLLMEVLREPTFPVDEVRREKIKKLAAIQSDEDRPGHVAQKAFDKRLFGDGPYGHPTEGTKESVAELGQEDVARFFRDYYLPNNSILAVVGDVEAASIDRLKGLMEAWPKGILPAAKESKGIAEAGGTIAINRPVTQSNIIVGHGGINRGNPDYYPVSVMNYILGGGGFSSRLTEEIRNKKGLAYSVQSFFDARRSPGPFEIVLQTKNASGRDAIALALEGMRLMQGQPVSEKELEGAKKYLVGSFPLRLNTQRKIAAFLTLVEYFGLGLDYPERYPSLINAVSREDVLRVAREYLHPDRYILVVVADLKQAGVEEEGATGAPRIERRAP